VADLVGSLASVMRQADVTELDLALGDVTIRLRRPARANEADPGERLIAEPGAITGPAPAGHLISAPMVGTFYASPTPSAPPFVRVGDAVAMGQTIGIIEAMKIMNEITADRDGFVEELLVENGQPVEYGSPLMRLTLGASEQP
jgi:acetyl-CoA carboxylase biotin carboxyl carrier protein